MNRKEENIGIRRILYLIVLSILVYVAILLVMGAGWEVRVLALRYWSLFAAGTCAIAVPHVLLPDTKLSLVQLLNPRPEVLLRRQLRRWSPILGHLFLPMLILAYYDPTGTDWNWFIQTIHLLTATCIVAGSWMLSLHIYGTIGTVSQEWQEGKRGGNWHTIQEHAPFGSNLGIPSGLIPAVTATGRVFLAGMLFTVGAALVASVQSPSTGLVVAAMLPIWSFWRLTRYRHRYDAQYYRTNAFYEEIFRSAGGVRASSREPIPYEAVYWVPARWKPHVWAGLRQFDRKLPLGRFILLGHLLLWILFYMDTDSQTIAGYLLLFSLTKNGIIYLLATPSFAPEPFQVIQQSPAAWVLTRFFINLRWTLPLFLSLFLIAIFDRDFSYQALFFWTILDVGMAFGTALVVTYLSEGKYRRRYA